MQANILPLIAALWSKIEQEHFSRLVAERLGVSQAAIVAEVAKLGAPEREEEKAPPQAAEVALAPLERKAGMLLFSFDAVSEVGARTRALLGAPRVHELEQRLLPHAEMLRYAFDNESAGEESEAAVAGDLLRSIEDMVTKEGIVKAGEDTKRIQELAQRSQELRT